MKNYFEGKIAVISGATSGIGKAIGTKLQAHGVKIINVSKDETPTDFFKNYVCNVADENQLIAVVDDVKRTFGKIDFLFCNAGMGMIGSVENAELSDVDTLFNVNLIAHAKMTKLLIPLIIDGGQII